MLGIGIGISPFFNKSTGGSTPTAQDYYLRTLFPDSNNDPAKRDDASLFGYGTDLYLILGWLGDELGETDQVWKSTDKGLTFTQQSAAPFTSGSQAAKLRLDGNIWIWGTSSAAADGRCSGDVYTFNSGGFTSIKSSTTPNMFMPIKILHNDKMYIIGGQTDLTMSPINNTDVYRYNDLTNDWDIVGQTPSTLWTCTGTGWSSGGYMYITGGGKINDLSGTYEFLNDKVYRSSDGATWSEYGTLLSGMTAMWPSAHTFNGKVWYITGYASGGNQVGMWNSANNGNVWTSFTTSITARHATSMCEFDNALYFGFGNFHNDLYRIEKITYPAQGFANDDVKNWWSIIESTYRPTTPTLTRVNAFVQGLIDDGDYDKIDVIVLIAKLDNVQQFIRPLKTNNTDFYNYITAHGSPVWTNGGCSGVLPDNVWILTWDSSNNGVQYTTTNAGIYTYLMAPSVNDATYDVGTLNSGMVFYQDGRFFGVLNSGSDVLGAAGTNIAGFRAITRVDGSQLTTTNDTTDKVSSNTGNVNSDFDVVINGVYNSGVYQASENTLGILIYGSGDIDRTKLRNRIITYLT